MNDGISKLSTDHSAQPNTSNRVCDAALKIGKGVSLNQASKDLRLGKWDVNPPITVTGPYDGSFFLASGRNDDSHGTEGTIKYTASDDATFFLDFNVPYSKANTAGIRCEGKDCNLYSYAASRVPESGYKTTPVYTITRK
jgi:Aegerolysin